MKKMMLGVAIVLGLVVAVSSEALAAGCHNDTRVSGYYRNNGTWVAPHYRTMPNHTQRDNWSSRPNRNPHTGAYGYGVPRY